MSRRAAASLQPTTPPTRVRARAPLRRRRATGRRSRARPTCRRRRCRCRPRAGTPCLASRAAGRVWLRSSWLRSRSCRGDPSCGERGPHVHERVHLGSDVDEVLLEVRAADTGVEIEVDRQGGHVKHTDPAGVDDQRGFGAGRAGPHHETSSPTTASCRRCHAARTRTARQCPGSGPTSRRQRG